jgi:hypothetical protein
MIFSVVKSTDAEWETAPYVILKGEDVFLEGIQEQSEAESLCNLLNQPPLHIVPINARPRWKSGDVGGRHKAAS